jgi:serine/threonine protein kinase
MSTEGDLVLKNSYIVSKTLGQGTFGKVKLGIHILTNEKVAIKILEKDKMVDQDDIARVSREITILKQIRHPHIVQLLDLIETDSHLYLIMEYASGGELFDYIVEKGRLSEIESCEFFQ